ncbi:unnamed protein product [Scytosiphon promiscuus]
MSTIQGQYDTMLFCVRLTSVHTAPRTAPSPLLNPSVLSRVHRQLPSGKTPSSLITTCCCWCSESGCGLQHVC